MTDKTTGNTAMSTKREWSGEPTPDGDFICHCSSLETEEEAIAMVKSLGKKKKAWYELNDATSKFVVKHSK